MAFIKNNMDNNQDSNIQVQQKSVIAAAVNEDVIERAVDKMGDALVKISDRYFQHQESKAALNTELEKENIKSQRQLNLMGFGMMSVVLVIAAVVTVWLKDIPPVLNSLLCFIIGYAAAGISGFIIQKGKKRNTPED
ncbi:MAG: hypothetical protein K2X48_07610 [Chitinophagaceae bacterium]|nr:hypothetical protein [Chitinophagaceae bacterium]